MRLVTGGVWQGQREWAVREWSIHPEDIADGAICDDKELRHAAVVDHFHLLVRRWMAAKVDVEARVEDMLKDNPDVIIITDEIGCGIVPIDREEREYREIHGRICCHLAEAASEVVRVYCGIGQRIK